MSSHLRKYMDRDGLGPILVKSVGGSAGISMLGMAFTFLLGWQLARGLGAAGYGVYGVAMAVVSILGVPSQFGLPQLLTREVASSNAMQDWARLKGALVWATRTAIASSLLIVGLMVIWIGLTGPGLHSTIGKTLAVGGLLVPLIALGAIAAAVLRGLLVVVLGQVPDTLIRPAMHSSLLLATLPLGIALSPALAMGAGVIAAAIALVIGVVLVVRFVPSGVVAAESRESRREWLGAAFPMALTEGLRVVQGQAAILALGAMVSMAEVGQFRVAASLMTIMVFPLSVINLVIGPHAASLASLGDRERLGRMLNHAALGMTGAVIGLTLPFLIAGDFLIVTIFGAEFGASNPMVLVLAIGMLANAVFGPGATALNMMGHHRWVTRASAWSVALLCMSIWPAITLWGSMGAAATVSLSMAVWSALLWTYMRRLEGVDMGAWGAAAGIAAWVRR